ncbi:MobA/MobL family protein [Labrenzia aggregata]|uniref:MobA/MobL family protein n=1 Tax=Roseibium aggregatum TaxID=187304 RepID=A0A926S8Y4_9HYPH|nr:MobA/MobL family protein [Roseibium aggregatum]
MAIYHLHVKNISRGDGRSAVAAAAYRAGETLPNEAEERLSAFGGRRDVLMNEIRLPEGAPAWMAERARLWNAVEAAEKRKDARLAKELEFALPRELPREAWPELARAMANAYTARGFVVDLAVHDDGTGHNPHAHLLLTTRIVIAEGFGGKIRSADGVQFVTEARAQWAAIANQALARAGVAASVDSRSHAARNLDQRPTVHRGPNPDKRRARRERVKREKQAMQRDPREDDLPVPDPDGSPIHPRELEAAEARLLDEMHRHQAEPNLANGEGRDAARAHLDGQNAREVSDEDARAYRLAPPDETGRENHLDWLDAPREAKSIAPAPERENYLDWLDGRDEGQAPEHDLWPEPERSR